MHPEQILNSEQSQQSIDRSRCIHLQIRMHLISRGQHLLGARADASIHAKRAARIGGWDKRVGKE